MWQCYYFGGTSKIIILKCISYRGCGQLWENYSSRYQVCTAKSIGVQMDEIDMVFHMDKRAEGELCFVLLHGISYGPFGEWESSVINSFHAALDGRLS